MSKNKKEPALLEALSKQDGNLLIGEFMGLPGNNCKYDERWDYLMPVVEKIESGSSYDEVDIFGKFCHIGNKVEKVGETKIQAVWLAVIDFILLKNN